MSKAISLLQAIVLLALAFQAEAQTVTTIAEAKNGVANDARAKYNYQLFCSGCHSPVGGGANGVPQIKGFIGNFLNSDAGREYLIRVPGSANSTLNDNQLAEVLNWIIHEFAGDSQPQQFTPYTAAEVARLRREPLFEVIEYRKKLIAELMAKP